MDKKLKAKWVRALRSGRYKQARYTLSNGLGANCCLGVLCRVARKSVNYDTVGNLMPMRNSNVLIHMNDQREASFLEIADYIERRKAL